jgi:hypothetical protein
VRFTNIRIYNSGPSVRIKSQCGRQAWVRNILYENITGNNLANAVWIDMQYFSTATSCPASEVSHFTNITVRNLDIGKADTAYTIVGLEVQGGSDGPIPMTGIVLENITVRDPGTLGECSWAEVTASDLEPALPPCANKQAPAPTSCAVDKVLGCYDDSKTRGLSFSHQAAVHDKTTFEVCAGACHDAGEGLAVAAIDDSNHCYCGSVDAWAKLASLKRPAAECDGHCHANHTEKGCGGKGRMVAYSYQGCKPGL